MSDEQLKVDAIHLIQDERQKQDEKWGRQRHNDGTWMLILMEEVGEAAEASLEEVGIEEIEKQIEEVTQVAAVAVAWLENLLEVKKVLIRQYTEDEQ